MNVWRPDDLLIGPRGRRLCYELLANTFFQIHDIDALELDIEPAGDRSEHFASHLARAADIADLPNRIRAADPQPFFSALVASVSSARYWQAPDDIDQALAHGDIDAALLPVAEFAARSESTSWWWDAVQLDNQIAVTWGNQADPASFQLPIPPLELQAWRTGTLEDEIRAQSRPDRLSDLSSGHWWSAPISRLVSTTRSLERLGAVGLAAVEDFGGQHAARCWPVIPKRDARIFEIDGPNAWVDLVDRWPLDVSRSRRHDWFRVTGLDTRWLIPDWQGVAQYFDGVHVTAAAYLATAGRALRVTRGHTVLAGWDPDATWWLTDVLTLPGRSTNWVLDEDSRPPDMKGPDSL